MGKAFVLHAAADNGLSHVWNFDFSAQILQYDMWGVTPTDLWDWAALKEKIAK